MIAVGDLFTPDEIGLARLLEKLGPQHPRLSEVYTYQYRLTENIASTRRYGDTEERRANRAEIVDRLNQLALETIGLAFHELCLTDISPTHDDLLDSLQFVTVPAGEFIMGTNKTRVRQAYEYEMPEHKVYLSTYQISKTPITNQLYFAFVTESKHRKPKHWHDGKIPVSRHNHPVVNVSWNDADRFCVWLSKKTQKHCRLPTEAEWEKAARGTDGRIYPWGNEWNKTKLNCSENGPNDTTPVGFYFHEGDSPYGAVDLCGNVWEWCNDWFGKDEYGKRQGFVIHNPVGPPDGQNRSVRGSTFSQPEYVCRSTNRFSFLPATLHSALGFRCVMESTQ